MVRAHRSASQLVLAASAVLGLLGSAQAGYLMSSGIDGPYPSTTPLGQYEVDLDFTVEAAYSVSGNVYTALTDPYQMLAVNAGFPVDKYEVPNPPAQWIFVDNMNPITSPDPDWENANPSTPDVVFWVKTVFTVASIYETFSGRLAADNKVEMFLNGDIDNSRTDAIAINPDPLAAPHDAGYTNPTNWAIGKVDYGHDLLLGENTIWFKITNLRRTEGNPASLLFESPVPAGGPSIVTPEPGTLSLLAIGGISLVGGTIRRRQNRATT